MRTQSSSLMKHLVVAVSLAFAAILFGFAATASAEPVVKTKTPNEGLVNKMSRYFDECPRIAGTRSTAEAKVAIMAAYPNSPEWEKAKARADIIASACRAEAETRYELAPRPVTAVGVNPVMTMPVITDTPAVKPKLML